jgi:hypothetical protein
VVIGMAACAALLVVPRAAEPIDLPLPRVDRSEQRVESRREHDLWAAAERNGLPYAIRAVGEQFRRIGKAAAGSSAASELELSELRQRVRMAQRAHGDAPLVALRAAQSRLFSAAVARWLSSGIVDDELRELGGNFPELAQARGWVRQGTLRAADQDLSSLYRIRWTVLTHLHKARAFSPSLNDWRAYFRMRLGYPSVNAATPEDLQTHLEDVRALAAKDPDYPESLARGVLSFHLRRYPDSVSAFREHLAEAAYGPWTLHARSSLAEAARRTAAPEGAEVW